GLQEHVEGRGLLVLVAHRGDVVEGTDRLFGPLADLLLGQAKCPAMDIDRAVRRNRSRWGNSGHDLLQGFRSHLPPALAGAMGATAMNAVGANHAPRAGCS